MSKDPFQHFADAIDLIRLEMQRLQRSSLDKDEARDLNASLGDLLGRMVDAAEDIRRILAEAPERLRDVLEADRAQMAQDAVESATRAAQKAVEGVRGELEVERHRYAESATEARRAARRSVRGSWAWFATAGLIGALLFALVIYGTETAKSVLSLEQEVRWGCGITVGQVVEQDDGSRYCATWIVTPEQAAKRRAREGG